MIEIQQYASRSQQARVLTEAWLHKNISCPACASTLENTPNNTKACDFICASCGDPFELKSKKSKFGNFVTDGAYKPMIASIRENRQANLFLLSYKLPFIVTELSVLPKYFLVEAMIVERKPLAQTARRAGWVGCKLNLQLIPKSALISCVVAGEFVAKSQIKQQWERSKLFKEIAAAARGWAAVTLGVVERIRKPEFSLQDVYEHEARLAVMFPNNRNIRPKLRQQLQVLREMGLVTFLGGGKYSISKLSNARGSDE